MDVNYLFLPLSVEAITGLELVLTRKDIDNRVLFRGCREITTGLKSAKVGESLPHDYDGIVVQLYSELGADDLEDLIDDHSRSLQQADILPIEAVHHSIDSDGNVCPAGTGSLLLAGVMEENSAYYSLSANCDLARRHCRVNLLPEIIYEPEEAVERFLLLRRELELYLGYGVRKFTGFKDNFYDLHQDKLMKSVRLVEVVAEERFPKFRDCLIEAEFRNDFVHLVLNELFSDPPGENGWIAHHTANDLFILFSLIRGLSGAEEWMERLPDSVPSDLKAFLCRIVGNC